MKVYLYELSENPKDLHFTEQDPWLVETVKNTQESELAKKPSYVVDMELRKLQEVVFLKGKLKLDVGLLCSRCANDFEHSLRSSFQCMFTRERSLTPGEGNVGVAHSEPTGATGEDLDIEFLEKDYIELADVLKEQIYLKLPFQPLCNEGCKGICPVCGQNQNTQPCQCHRLKNTALANALRNYRT
jgi:uncharacterized protein